MTNQNNNENASAPRIITDIANLLERMLVEDLCVTIDMGDEVLIELCAEQIYKKYIKPSK